MLRYAVAGRRRVGRAGPALRSRRDERFKVGDHLQVKVADHEQALTPQGGQSLGGAARGRGELAEPIQLAGQDLVSRAQLEALPSASYSTSYAPG
jgi:hypothetical protein